MCLVCACVPLSVLTEDALEKKWGRHTPSSAVVQGAYMATFAKSAAEKEYADVRATQHRPLTHSGPIKAAGGIADRRGCG